MVDLKDLAHNYFPFPSVFSWQLNEIQGIIHLSALYRFIDK